MDSKVQRAKCIGIIMDGNRRWAKSRGLQGFEGHSKGYRKLKEVLGWVEDAGINEVIVYAFSTENWKRTNEEVGALMKLLTSALSDEIESLTKENVRLKFVGNLTLFPKALQNLMKEAEEKTAGFDKLTLTIALSYGGRAEILQAAKRIATLSKEEFNSLNEESFKNFLWTTQSSDPDLIIRTGGELRMSNFLPYQSVYSELFFTKTLWPEFSKEEFENILHEFGERKRNLGR